MYPPADRAERTRRVTGLLRGVDLLANQRIAQQVGSAADGRALRHRLARACRARYATLARAPHAGAQTSR
jgi:hypothetical protein